MQALVQYSFTDQTRFRAAFDADSEDQGQNGLSLLQLWRENTSTAWALFQVNDPARARAYLQQGSAAFNAQAGIEETSFRFLETA